MRDETISGSDGEAGAASRSMRARFQSLARLQRYARTYDPIILLCAFGGTCLVSFRSELSDLFVRGHMAQAPLELLQALILRVPPAELGTRKPRKATIDWVTTHGVRVTQRQIDRRDEARPGPHPDPQSIQPTVLKNIELARQLLRHNGFPQQIVPTMRAVFGPSDACLKEACGITFTGLIAMLNHVARLIEDRYRDYVTAQNYFYEARASEYASALERWFPRAAESAEWLRRMSALGLKRAERRRQVVAFLDAQLPSVFTLDLADLAAGYGPAADPDTLRAVVDRWAHHFGDLCGEDPDSFALDNPVLRRPLIALSEGTYLCPFPWLFFFSMREILEELAASFPSVRERFGKTAGHALGHFVAETFRQAFPTAEVHEGLFYRDGVPGDRPENDVLVLIDRYALIVEVKGAKVTDKAAQGSPGHVRSALRRTYHEGWEQAIRFHEHLRGNWPAPTIEDARGRKSTLDLGGVSTYLPFVISLSRIGTVGSIARSFVPPNRVKETGDIAPLLTPYELLAWREILPLESQRLHYLVKRHALEALPPYATSEGEFQILEHYLETGLFLDPARDYAQKPLRLHERHAEQVSDYFSRLWLGLPASLPRANLSGWWRALVLRTQQRREPNWTQRALALLDTPRAVQDSLASEIRNTADRLALEPLRTDYRRIVRRVEQQVWGPFHMVALVYCHLPDRQLEILKREGLRAIGTMGDDYAVGIGVNALYRPFPCDFIIEA
jgi:hypothetical protein